MKSQAGKEELLAAKALREGSRRRELSGTSWPRSTAQRRKATSRRRSTEAKSMPPLLGQPHAYYRHLVNIESPSSSIESPSSKTI
jgi:hypothetical protein